MFARWRKAAGPAEEVREPRRSEVTFEGLEPWAPGTGLTRCRAGQWSLDLREDATFLGYDFGEYGMLTLRWYHDATPDGPPRPQRVTLDFDLLRGFRAEDVPPGTRVPGETQGWDYTPASAGRAYFTVRAGDADLMFSAAGVRLRTDDLDG
jgi:hypothetical protein